MSRIRLLQVLQLQDKKKGKNLTLEENLIRCYNENKYVDVVLKVEDRIFRAHKSILFFHSPVLKKSLPNKDISSTTYAVKGIKPKGFEILLRYLYTSEVSNEVESGDLVEACYAAQLLQMEKIREKLHYHIMCRPRPGKKYSGKTIAEVQFWSLLEKCVSLELQDLQEKLLKFAESNLTFVFESESFVAADFKIIKLVFDRKCLSRSQSYILESIARWAEANQHLVSLDQHIRELLNYIDFKSLHPKEFYAVASKFDRLLSKKDSLDILMHLVDPTVCPLPEWYQLVGKVWNIPVNKEMQLKTLDEFWNNLSSPPGDWRKRDLKSKEDLSQKTKVENLKQKESKLKSDGLVSGTFLQESFCQMLKEGLFTDVTLIAKNNSQIPAHRLILALESEFFKRVFYDATPTSKTFHMEETAEDVKDMLRYFYGNGKTSIYGMPVDLILRKTGMAMKYQCYPLMQVCNSALSLITLSPGNFWTLADWMVRESHTKINPGVLMNYVATSTKQVFENHSFLKSSKDSLVMVLKSDYLNMPEDDILEHVSRWMKENSKQLPTDNSRKEILGNIRFESLEAENVFAFLKKNEGLLPMQDSFAILEFLFRRCEDVHLPAWCYRGALRSIFYNPSMKIGTTVPIPWSGSPAKGKNSFSCSYTISLRDQQPKSEIQFLEVSLKIKPPEVGQCGSDCTCSITLSSDDGKGPLMFPDLNMSRPQRYLLPVSFSLDESYNRSIKLVLTVNSRHSHKFHSVTQQVLGFDKAVFKVMSAKNNNFLCDAVVDGFTSENVRIPPHLLSKKKIEDFKTEKYFKVLPESRARSKAFCVNTLNR